MKPSFPLLTMTLASAALASCGRSPGSVVESASNSALRTVEVTPKLVTDVAPILDKDALSLDFELDGDAALLAALELTSYQCKLAEDVAWRDCSAKPFELTGLTDATAYTLTVHANLTDKATKEAVESQSLVISFAVDLPGGAALDPEDIPSDGPAKISVLSSRLQLGASYAVEAPKGFHVTEYWNQLSYGGSSWYRVLAASDPHYLGGDVDCSSSKGATVEAQSSSGRWYSYCKTSAQGRDFDLPYQGTEAYIELATDAEDVSATNHERFFLSTYNQTGGGDRSDVLRMYDSEGYLLEVPSGLRKFAQVCQGKDVNFIDVPMINNFFLGRAAETVRFWYCDAILPSATGTPTPWKIGAFVERDQPDAYCSACSASARTIEAVYLLRPSEFTYMPAYFARKAQERIGSMLTKVLP